MNSAMQTDLQSRSTLSNSSNGIQPFDPNITPIVGTMLLEASAGTGKTYALEHMVARLVGLQNYSIEQILVVTFTNKAAREMRERIRKIFVSRAMEIQRDDAERNRYKVAISKFNTAPIYTIHSFCRMVLASWPFEAAVPFQQTLVTDNELEIEEIRNWISSFNLETATIDSTIFQAAYNKAKSGEELIRAIAHHLANESLPEQAILYPSPEDTAVFRHFLADANDPNGNLSSALHKLFQQQWTAEAIKTIFAVSGGTRKPAARREQIQEHMAWCSGLQGLPALEEGIFANPPNTNIGNHFLDLLFTAFRIKDQTLNDEAGKLHIALCNLITTLEPFIEFRPEDRSKKVVCLIEKYMECLFFDLAQTILQPRIEAKKNIQGIWNYTDLIRRTFSAIEKTDSPLKYVLRNRFKVALIDEFQDTDPLQWKMFHNIFCTPSHRLVLIGDPKQSIYGFRGTGLQAYRTAITTIPQEQRYRLTTNYRSRPPLVEAINTLFLPVFQTHCDGGDPVHFEPVSAGKSFNERLQWTDADNPITILYAENKDQIADGIVAEIRSMLDPQTGATWLSNNGKQRPLQASEIAVLVRSHTEGDSIISKLTHLRIPAIRYRETSIFNQPIIEPLTELLESIENSRYIPLWRSVFLGYFFRLAPDLLLQFEESGKLDIFPEKGIRWRKIFNTGNSIEALNDFFSFATILGVWARQANRITEANRLEQPWPKRILVEENGDQYWQDWRHIGELIQQKQSAGLRDIPNIISWIRNTAATSPSEEMDSSIRLATESPAIRVMTMHTAKGLQFPLVFLHGGYKGKTKRNTTGKDYRFESKNNLIIDRLCREENFNHQRAHEWEEAKRLWYVAFTRASWKVWAPLLSEGSPNQLDSFWSLTSKHGMETESALPPHESLDNKDISNFREGLITYIKNSPTLAILPVNSQRELPPLPLSAPIAGRIALHPKTCTSERDPSTTSYTSLIHQTEKTAYHSIGGEDRDIDALNTPVFPDENIPLNEDRGPIFGTFIHSCLEHCNLTLATEPQNTWTKNSDVEDLLSDQATRYYSPHWYKNRKDDLKNMLWHTLQTPLGELGPICNLPDHTYRREVEFQIHICKEFQLAIDSIRLQINQGFLKGYIDLIAYKDERWWIVDWKTNIPKQGEGYATLMEREHYHLQYEIYLLSLCCCLSSTLKRPLNWEKEIGGAIYVFLRGIAQPNGDAIQINKPLAERMNFLAQKIGHPRILK